MEYKIFLAYLAVAVEIASYAIYFVGIWRGKTKPHAFTWLVWGTLNIVGFAAVLTSGGEAVAWILGINALANFTIASIGFYQKNVQYDKYDWSALIGAFVGIFLWWLSNNPLYAIILVSISDVIGYIPTFRKAYRLPLEENLAAFAFGIPYYVLALLALESLVLTNWLYPAVIILVDGSLVVLIYLRRKKLLQ